MKKILKCKAIISDPPTTAIKIIVAGSRSFKNEELAYQVLDDLIKGRTNVQIVSGMANGADKIGYKYGMDRGLELMEMWADWDTYGKRAGYLRNEEMAKYADACVVFWDGKSPGTKNMISLAKKYNLVLKVVNYG